MSAVFLAPRTSSGPEGDDDGGGDGGRISSQVQPHTLHGNWQPFALPCLQFGRMRVKSKTDTHPRHLCPVGPGPSGAQWVQEGPRGGRMPTTVATG